MSLSPLDLDMLPGDDHITQYFAFTNASVVCVLPFGVAQLRLDSRLDLQ